MAGSLTPGELLIVLSYVRGFYKPIRKAIIKHNKQQNGMASRRGPACDDGACLPASVDASAFAEANLLLPMAFPEGSPMHPAYGAGHATVAGGCVTMLKAFFEMFQDCDGGEQRELCDAAGQPIVYVPSQDGSRLVEDAKFEGPLTIEATAFFP